MRASTIIAFLSTVAVAAAQTSASCSFLPCPDVNSFERTLRRPSSTSTESDTLSTSSSSPTTAITHTSTSTLLSSSSSSSPTSTVTQTSSTPTLLSSTSETLSAIPTSSTDISLPSIKSGMVTITTTTATYAVTSCPPISIPSIPVVGGISVPNGPCIAKKVVNGVEVAVEHKLDGSWDKVWKKAREYFGH